MPPTVGVFGSVVVLTACLSDPVQQTQVRLL